MKKLLAGVLACAMLAFGLCGCAANTEAEPVSDTKSPDADGQGEAVETAAPDVEPTADEGVGEYAADVVIVGAGGAGMCAALMAADAGASVVVIEKSAAIGGNTMPAQGGISAVDEGITEEEFIEVQTNEDSNPELVKTLVENSADAVAWLNSIGMDLVQKDGNPRVHIPSDGTFIGETLSKVLYENTVAKGIRILFTTTATELIEEDGAVKGVKAIDADGRELVFCGSAVVLATGGWGKNMEMVAKYRPDLANGSTTEVAPTAGDGVIMAQALGADVTDMDEYTTHVAIEYTTRTMITNTMRKQDFILINAEGNRFTDEGTYTFDAVLSQTGAFAYCVFDQAWMDAQPLLQDCYDMGIVREADSIEALAGVIGVDAGNFVAAVDKWNEDFPTGTDSVYGRTTRMVNDLSHAPYYAIKITAGVHYCLGGLVINTDTQVIKTDGTVIDGLYAAGEVTGGVHGNKRVDSSAVADTVVYGRIAGTTAANYALSKGTVTPMLPAEAEAPVPSVNGSYTDGTYTGTARGRNGDVTVQVTVRGGNITDISIVDSKETFAVFTGVERELIPEIIKAQSVNVDAVSGATLSSFAVKSATAQALGLS